MSDIKRVSLEEPLVQELINYLLEKPAKETMQLIAKIQNTAKYVVPPVQHKVETPKVEEDVEADYKVE